MNLAGHPNLNERIRSLVREMIVNGDLAPDCRINEVLLAKHFDVSRTPLREALTALVGEGALTSIARRGFFVRPLSIDEFRNIYPIRGLLDPEALGLAGIPSSRRIARLKRLNERLRKETEPAKRVLLDDQWHLELIADCPNPVLLELIAQFMQRTRRYELAFYRETSNVEISIADHRRVVDAAQRGDLDSAMDALRANMSSGTEAILRWLETRYPNVPSKPRKEKS